MVIVCVAWGGALSGTFQFDDLGNVVHDPATTDAAALLARLSHGLRPLVRLSYFADAQVFGMRAAGFLATNLLLHIVTALLVFALARRRLDVASACVASLVFALQPANGEVVAYVTGRSTGLMAPLLLTGVLLHDRGHRGAALVSFVLACLAKEVALVFPVLVLVWDATAGQTWRQALRSAATYFIAAGAALVGVLLLASHRAMIADALVQRPIHENLVVNGRAVPTMLSLWVRPNALSVDHQFSASGQDALGIVGLVCIVAALVVAVAARRRIPALMLAVVWALVCLLPTSSVLAKPDLVTEKPLYLAWVGPAIALGIAFAAIRSRLLAAAIAGVVVVAMAAGSMWRARMWSDPVRLWEEATAHAPTKSRCWNNLGMAYRRVGRDADANAAFQRAYLLDPSSHEAAMNLELARVLGP